MLDRMLLAAGGEEKLYVEDVFSTYLYTGNGSTQTITNGIDLAGKGGLVWIKSRAGTYVRSHYLYDTARGTILSLSTDTTGGNANNTPNGVTSFNANGFTALGPLGAGLTDANTTYTSWTFREAPKFFDVVTYTGDGTARTIAHNLGVAPGTILVKRTDVVADWQVYHRSNANTEYMVLNTTAAKATGTTRWNSTTPTATEFTVGTDATVNASGGTYVAYLFAHDPTADGIIQCGSYTGNSSAPVSVNLGWEPQWLLVKPAAQAATWHVVDNMRGFFASTDAPYLQPNTSSAETTGINIYPTATGFVHGDTTFTNLVYIAIRRGPMKTPTVGTTVFMPVATRSSGVNDTTPMFNAGFPVDVLIQGLKSGNASLSQMVINRLTASRLVTALTDAEVAVSSGIYSFAGMLGVFSGSGGNNTDSTICGWNFRRAPSFFDVVCYTGTGVARTVNHNLGVAPELMIVKRRDNVDDWGVYAAPHPSAATGYFKLNTSATFNATSTAWDNTQPTSSVFTVGTNAMVGASGANYVAYLFASCPGVSKVGLYTGNGSSQTINCDFSNGARFFLVKRTDSTGDWWVYDSARGIVAAADPALRLNSTAAEVTSADAVDTNSTGIIVNQEATCNINVNGATYIYLAIA